MPHQQPHHPLIFYFFPLFKLIFSLLKKKKKKTLFYSLLVHSCCYTSSTFLLPLCLSLLSILPLHFIIFSFLYFDSSSPHFILYKFDIISLIQSIHKNCEYSLSLLSFGGFLFFHITLIKVEVFSFCFFFFFFYFINVFWYCVFLISHYKIYSLPFIDLVEF